MEPTNNSSNLPTEIVDSHHHFMDTQGVSKKFLGSLLGDFAYLPEDYHRDVVENLRAHGIKLVGSVHVEGIPDDGLEEASWVASVSNSTVAAIVASCDLASSDAETTLQNLKKCSPKVKGIRWILDCVGTTFEPNTATHIAVKRHAEGKHDYLRGNQGQPLPEFEKGFALLSQYDLSFDLQCAPAQLVQAAALCARHPSIPVCINHLGKLRPDILHQQQQDESADNESSLFSKQALEEWRAGMKAMAQLPNTYVKISMLGYIVPGWIRTPERVALVKNLVGETVELFGPKRSMVALNW